MTISQIAAKVEHWEIALQRAQDSQIKLNRRLDVLTIKIDRLKAKIAKNKPYKTYYEREGKSNA